MGKNPHSARTSRIGAIAVLVAGALIVTAVVFAVVASAGYGPRPKAGLKLKRVLSTHSYTIKGSNNPQRFEVFCPRGKRPLGGGVRTDPQPDGRGAGAFPVAYERLGQQQGWHISMAQVGRSGSTSVTLQVLCAKYNGPLQPQEKFIMSRTYKNVRGGQTKQFTQTCPHGTRLLTGGDLTSQFFSNSGVYVTESRMSSDKSWTVSATGVPGSDGGQVSAIAYCARSRKPLITEVASPPVTVTPGHTGTATTPDCPPGRHLITGGFSAPRTLRIFDGAYAGLDHWTASAAPYTGSGEVTAYGYCL